MFLTVEHEGTTYQNWSEEALKAEIGDEAFALAIRPVLEAECRKERDRLLIQSDWTQMADSPLTAEAKQAWAAYRQALRDITVADGFPIDIVWPAAPEVA